MTNAAFDCLGEAGPLAGHVQRFTVRKSQQEMAATVYDALLERQTLIVEAGTGTGKTFAYLVPAILSAKKIIISTGTKTLQDQLFQRDLPLVQNALERPLQTAILKGRANYLCLHRLDLAVRDPVSFHRNALSELEHIRSWSGRTGSGDIAELNQIPEDSRIWSTVTSTIDNCLGQDCKDYKSCYVVKARRDAQDTDILIINHHLLLADMLLKDTGFGELLPGAEAFIIDEAHQLPEIATLFFGTTLSYRQLNELVRDVEIEYINEFGSRENLTGEIESVRKAINDFRLSLGRDTRKQMWDAVLSRESVHSAFQHLQTSLEKFHDWVSEQLSHSDGLDNCQKRVDELLKRLTLMSDHDQQQFTCWIETQASTFIWHLTPIDISNQFEEIMDRYDAAWVFTSATLAVGESFEHFSGRLGINSDHALRYESPFAYQQHALLYLPESLPDPNSAGYTPAVVAMSLPLINACHGGVFFLFTSYRALREAELLVKDRVNKTVLIQGQAPRSELLDQFRHCGNALLLATSSFWEGVDVRGSALSCVIIDKIPFASPGDPVLQARINMARKEGRNPFMEFQVPQAVISLKQGVGRLIRDIYDKGVMVLCDPRLTQKPYGRIFLRSLPSMKTTHESDLVLEFFAHMETTAENA